MLYCTIVRLRIGLYNSDLIKIVLTFVKSAYQESGAVRERGA